MKRKMLLIVLLAGLMFTGCDFLNEAVKNRLEEMSKGVKELIWEHPKEPDPKG